MELLMTTFGVFSVLIRLLLFYGYWFDVLIDYLHFVIIRRL